ncbi:hypothetical protein KIMC2_14710 [Xylocopilactobacillus apis]|uniref:Uncharacterized protein n=1 Tax=Xylocopilactobacillus apis TaxID=2932183 RepID=A0AAU9CSF0_9LACO|nr:hypothetical protein KIMC2_14710 [Xylocopilactobacillus apis]
MKSFLISMCTTLAILYLDSLVGLQVTFDIIVKIIAIFVLAIFAFYIAFSIYDKVHENDKN